MKTPRVARTLTVTAAALALFTVSMGSAWAQHAGGGFHGGGGAIHGGAAFHGGPRGFYGGFHGYGFRGGYGFHGYGGYGWRWAPGWGWWWWGWGLPLGAYLSVLPYYYSTLWWDGVPYYYANGDYYLWNGTAGQYEQVQPPPEVAQQANGAAPMTGAPDAGAGMPPMSEELYAYPKNGQSPDQQATDKRECRDWASGQVAGAPPAPSSGSNAPPGPPPGTPGAPGAAGTPPAGPPASMSQQQNYLRAEAACLEARGYSVQ